METKLWAVLTLICTTFLTSTAQLLYKFGINSMKSFNLISLITNYYLLGGVLLYIIGGTLMILAFRGGDLSVLYPIIATGFIWVSFFSVYFLNESMNLFKWTGVLGIVAGIIMIGFGSREKEKSVQGMV